MQDDESKRRTDGPEAYPHGGGPRRIPVAGEEGKPESEPVPEPDGPVAPASGPGGEAEAGDDPETVTLPKAELEELRGRLAERETQEDRIKRIAADYANSQKRLEREARTRIDYAIQEFAKEILPVMDSLDRALGAAEQSRDVERFIEGIRLVDKQFHDILARHGVQPIETNLGETFDPEVHDVLAVTPTDEYPEHAVVEVVERGFKIKDRVLRPSKVLVAKPSQEQ
jgi:molecular chaperone GrpE